MFLAEQPPGPRCCLRGGDMRKSMSDYLARRIERHPKIEVIRNVEVDAVEGDRTITRLRLRDVRDGNSRDLDCSAVFVFIGAQPRTDWLPPSIAVDSKGFILTGADAAKSDRWPLDGPRALFGRDDVPGSFRRGRRPQRYDQTGRVCRRRRGAGGHCAHTGCSRRFDRANRARHPRCGCEASSMQV